MKEYTCLIYFWFGWAVGLLSAWCGIFIANHIL